MQGARLPSAFQGATTIAGCSIRKFLLVTFLSKRNENVAVNCRLHGRLHCRLLGPISFGFRSWPSLLFWSLLIDCCTVQLRSRCSREIAMGLISLSFCWVWSDFIEFHWISSDFIWIPSNLLNSFGFTWTHWISPKFHWISSEFYRISSEFHLSFIEFHLNSFPRTPSSFVANDGSSERTHGDSPGFAGNPKPSKLSPAKRCESARWSLGCRWAESRRTVAVQPRGDPHAERCFGKLVRLPVCVS